MTLPNQKIVGVLVAYNSPGDAITSTVARLAPQLHRLLVQDNSDAPAAISEAIERANIQNVEYHSSGGNVGIAAAQNQGIARAKELDAGYVLFLDDDSKFPEDGAATLLSELANQASLFPETVAIGPKIVDERTGQALIAVWKGDRVRPGHVTTTTEVAYLVSSGALVDMLAFEKYGVFRSEYFIDHVDQEWGFRVGLRGGRSVITAKVTMVHQLGDSPTQSRRGSTRYRHDSPTRDYYLTRNAIFLMRDLKFPLSKYFGFVRTLSESAIRKVFGRGRTRAQRVAVLLGLFHGVINRRGPRPS